MSLAHRSRLQPRRAKNKGRFCKGCGEFVRLEHQAVHGVPKAGKRASLTQEQQNNVLKMAARSPTYCLATPFCPRSLLLRDLSEYYGSEAKVEALASAQRRIVACLLCRERPLYNIPVTEYMQSSIDACVRPLCASPPSRYNQDECLFSTDGVEKRDPACEAIKYIR